ncbi:MAG: nitrile hydratase subunit beta [Alphaproteobacteria bacterium]|jgi:nitrile hydratase|nr:nitrile hydratase subunit beta [Alphaproteobacteria bacterium]
MPIVDLETVRGLYKVPGAARLDLDIPARFKAGDLVVARNINPPGHTRLPRYIRGKQGSIRRDHGVFHFPDAAAHGLTDRPQHTYSVRFSAQELWGPEAPQKDALYIDMWDDYLEPA